MRAWQLIPIGVIAIILVALPAAALTETGIEKDLKRALNLDTGECEPITNSDSPWIAGPSLPFNRDEPRAVAIGDRVYLVGGITGLQQLPGGGLFLRSTDSLTRFDPVTGKYLELASLPRRLNHIGVATYRGDLYVLGGYGRSLEDHTSGAFYRYDPDSNRWSRMPDMPEPRAAMAVGVIGDHLISAGGARDNVPLADTFAFSFRSHRWSQLPDMPSRREHAGEAVVGGKLYVLGGRGPQSLALDTAERFDPVNLRWERLPPLPVATGGLAGVSADGEAIAIGGGNDARGTVTGAVQEFDPSSDSWAQLPGLRTPRHGHGAAIVGGNVWVFGGSACAYFNASDLVERLQLSQ